jgi:hypothetical protein
MKIVFTHHAELRLKKRKILREEAIEAIKFPDRTIKKYGQHYYQKQLGRGAIEVVCEKTESNINIITIYWL